MPFRPSAQSSQPASSPARWPWAGPSRPTSTRSGTGASARIPSSPAGPSSWTGRDPVPDGRLPRQADPEGGQWRAVARGLERVRQAAPLAGGHPRPSSRRGGVETSRRLEVGALGVWPAWRGVPGRPRRPAPVRPPRRRCRRSRSRSDPKAMARARREVGCSDPVGRRRWRAALPEHAPAAPIRSGRSPTATGPRPPWPGSPGPRGKRHPARKAGKGCRGGRPVRVAGMGIRHPSPRASQKH